MATRTSKMVAGQNGVAAAKNAMRDALIVMHNSGNKKACSEEVALGAGVSSADFKTWKKDVEALRTTVWNYVELKFKARNDEKVTAAQLTAARELIFPKWKEVLGGGEKRCLEREIHVDPYDVEDLIGFSWDFMTAGEAGTIACRIGEGVFRKKVESLIGVLIAKNEILNDEDRDILTSYYGYGRTIQKCIDRQAEIDQSIKELKLIKGRVKDEKEYVKYLKNTILELEKELAESKKTKEKAEADMDKISEKAQAIQDRLKKI